MPVQPTDPLLHTFSRLAEDRPMPLLSRTRVIGERLMISRVILEKGCDVPTHAHDNEQMAVILSGRLRFGLGAENDPQRRTVIATEGQVVHLPGGLPHSAYAEERTEVLDVFAPPSQHTGIDSPSAGGSARA